MAPRICLGPARAMYVGPALELDAHLNVATTLAVALHEPFMLRTWTRTGGWSPWEPRDVAVIASGTLHHLRGGGPMAFLYLDPMTDPGVAATARDLALGRQRMLAAAPQSLGLDAAFAAFGLTPRPPRDARIARVVAEIERHPDAFAHLADAAARACLSPSRFRARFAAELGLPFRRYRLWRRMAAVMRTLHAGGNLTGAAHAAGFASSAHLSSAFKRMFGLSPSDVVDLRAVIDLSDDAVLGEPGAPGTRRPAHRAGGAASSR